MTTANPPSPFQIAARYHDANPMPVCLVDDQGQLQYANPAARQLMERYGHPDDAASILPPGFHEIQKNCVAAGVEIPVTEVSLGRKIIEWRAFPLEEATITQYIGLNISHIRQKEDRLNRARQAAEEGQIAKQAFLDNMTHEIRTPLNSLLGFTNLLREELWDQLGEDQRMYFSLIQQNGDRLARTMREILDASLIASGNLETNLELLDLNPILEEAAERFAEAAALKGLSFQVEPASGSNPISTDAYCLQQVLEHLVDNAVKYTQAGSVTISAEANAEHLVIEVKDTGPGLSEEYMSRIFTPFNQESFGHSKHFQGIGLGLSLVRGYADLVGMLLDIESTPAGTQFRVSIPLAAAD